MTDILIISIFIIVVSVVTFIVLWHEMRNIKKTSEDEDIKRGADWED